MMKFSPEKSLFFILNYFKYNFKAWIEVKSLVNFFIYIFTSYKELIDMQKFSHFDHPE